ncbi:hypothetical protein GALL_469670 [mine drainage metagenome]|uniref:Uncharacterized protein n=1 Tax=mine drainage metagenome TaxID=410659 RepID=A0A1J5PKS6_9ZZZZ
MDMFNCIPVQVNYRVKPINNHYGFHDQYIGRMPLLCVYIFMRRNNVTVFFLITQFYFFKEGVGNIGLWLINDIVQGDDLRQKPDH